MKLPGIRSDIEKFGCYQVYPEFLMGFLAQRLLLLADAILHFNTKSLVALLPGGLPILPYVHWRVPRFPAHLCRLNLPPFSFTKIRLKERVTRRC